MANILFIDDVPEIVRLYSLVLTKKGHEVTVASSVMQAMMSLKGIEYDYVFVDLDIPDIDGFDFIKQSHLESDHPHTKVIILSNRESPRDIERARKLGVERYLVKIDNSPYGLAQLIDNHQI